MILPLGAIPRLPDTAAPRSVRISPKRLDATITSTLAGGPFNVVVLYTFGDYLDGEQIQALATFVRNGGGLVGVHTAIATSPGSETLGPPGHRGRFRLRRDRAVGMPKKFAIRGRTLGVCKRAVGARARPR